jgi:hypothetical protein
MCRSKAEGGRRCRPKNAGSSAGVPGSGCFASSGASSRTRRSRAAVLRIAQEQLRDLLDAAVNAAPVDSAATVVSAVDADIANQIADAITTTLEVCGYPRGSRQSHLLCGALAAVAQAMTAGEDLARAAVTKGVTAALVVRGMTPSAASLVGRAAADTLMKLTPVRHWEDVRRAVQLLAASTCPNDPEVEQYCLQPLVSELLSSSIQKELAE